MRFVSPSGDHQGAAGMHVQAMHQRGGVRDNTSGDRGIRRRGSLHDVRALQTSLRLAIDEREDVISRNRAHRTGRRRYILFHIIYHEN